MPLNLRFVVYEPQRIGRTNPSRKTELQLRLLTFWHTVPVRDLEQLLKYLISKISADLSVAVHSGLFFMTPWIYVANYSYRGSILFFLTFFFNVFPACCASWVLQAYILGHCSISVSIQWWLNSNCFGLWSLQACSLSISARNCF